MASFYLLLCGLSLLWNHVIAVPTSLVSTSLAEVSANLPEASDHTCRKTKVVILGAGEAGITAAQTLSNHSISDFLILEYNSNIGGRARSTQFGADPSGNPYTVELGANWIQGLANKNGRENPIWTMAKKYGLANQYSNYSNIQTYNQDGPLDTFIQKQAEFDLAYAAAQNSSVAALDESEQTDRSMRDALHAAGWDPKGDALAEAVEWYAVDFEYAQTAEVASERHTLANYRSTFHDYSPENNFVTDPRGFAHLIRSQAAEFLAPNDPRLLLSTTVTSITWSGSSVQIQTSDGTCISAEHAINTFSAGVLQSDLVHFNPPLPDWKRQAISKVQMGVYTKIFMQFSSDRIFWPQDTEFFLYADNNSTTNPSSSAPLFHSPPAPFPQDILIATITTGPPSNSNETEAHLLSTLQNMFPGTPIPQPKAFMYPLWNELEWARGSFSNWPVGMTRAEHDALGEPTGNLWFAGEAGSKEYWGFLQGAFEEGKRVGGEVARCVIEGGCKERTEKQGQKVMG